MIHKADVFFVLASVFAGGVFAGSFFVFSQTLLYALIILGVIIALLAWQKARQRFILFLVGLSIIVFSLGIFHIISVKSDAGILSNLITETSPVVISGYIFDVPEIRGQSQRFVLKAKILHASSKETDKVILDERILITADLYPKFEYGQRLELRGEMNLPENHEDSDFDYVAYLAKDRIYTIMSFPKVSKADIEIETSERVKIALFEIIFKVKEKFEGAINRSVAEPNAAFINGILLGTRSQIPDDLKEDFAVTGTTHILAISGYNITIVAMVLSWFFVLFVRRQVAFWFAVCGIILFTILVGAQASVVRASIMGILVLLARRTGRLNNVRNTIVLAGVIMIYINPLVLRFDVGFQLSFMATLGLVYVAPVIEKYFERLPTFFELRETVIMTTSAQLFVLPLLIYHFNSISLASIPVNVLVLPFVPYNMLFGFLTGILGIVSVWLGIIFGYIAWFISSLELTVIRIFAKFDWAALTFSISWYVMVLSYIILIIFLYYISHEKK
ncbi:MAG: ComEC/Rec2 family competence protein [Parcubacteria group bacterium]